MRFECLFHKIISNENVYFDQLCQTLFDLLVVKRGKNSFELRKYISSEQILNVIN